MGLRTKTLIIISLTLISLIATLYIMSQIILLKSFADLEEQRAREDIERVLSALAAELTNLDTTTQDYAEWDDTYTFVVDGNQDYIDANLTDLTFIDLRLNLILFINTAGQVVYGKSFDLANNQIGDVPTGLNAYLSANSPLMKHPDIESHLAGIVLLPEGPMLVASRPILTNESQGPSPGTLIFGRYLDAGEIERLADITHLSLTMYLFSDLPPDFQAVKASLSKQTPIFTQPLSAETIAGYALIEDIEGKPILILRVDLPRNIYRQGQSSIAYFLASLMLTGLVFTLIALWLLERLVLTRLLRLSTEVNEIGAKGKFSTRVPVSGNDELANLSQAINEMLGTLQQSRDTLREAHDKLEKRVEERTVELSQINVQLKLEIAERKQIEEALIGARDRALEASRLKTELLAKVSHELRTPLGAILGFAELLKLEVYGDLTDQQQQATTKIVDSTHYLTTLVNELLHQARLEAGKLELNTSAFAPTDLVRDTVAQMSILAHNKNLTLNAEIDDNMPVILFGDSARVQQILVNLISNAIKFTETGTIQVRLCQPDSVHWAIQVSDTGPGIPVEAQAYIFEPFRQVDGSMTREHSGTGLGLSIVKQLTTLMGGQITLESEVGQGSTFTVLLPLHPAQEKVI
jgi:signal transduction histidine kinase